MKSQSKINFGTVLWMLLIAGIILRIVVFFVASPFNSDGHWEVIQWIVDNHAFPTSELMSQSYQPPLYYFLMALLAKIGDGVGPVQAGSFVFSCTNLLVIYLVVRRTELFPLPGISIVCLGLAALLPEYVMFSHFISNDTLTILLGTLLSIAVYNYIAAPQGTMRGLVLIAVLVGLGLLTKGTFLLIGPVLTLLIAVIETSRGVDMKRLTVRLGLFCTIWLLLGSYKYIENLEHFGRPIVHNLDFNPDWTSWQRGTFKGVRTIIDINPLPLIRQPILNEHDMRESYPQLLYATFWYTHMRESSFQAGRHGYAWVGSCLYIVGILPAVLFLAGVYRGVVATFGWLRRRDPNDVRSAVLAMSIAMLAANFLVVIVAGVRYDVWSCFQSRLCFQSMLPALVIFGEGIIMAMSGRRTLRAIIYGACGATLVCCVIYFCVEIIVAYKMPPEQFQWR